MAQRLFVIMFMLIFSHSLLANTQGVASVVKLKGEVTYTNPTTGKSEKLAEGMWLNEMSVIKSENKSFARLVFIDKSTMTVGPNSEVEIKQFPKQEAGVINLLKGKIRSEVTKNYLDMKDKDSSKLYITTKTAAMGVRGTDFQVTYNPESNVTGLITYSGAVAMNRFRETVDFNNRPRVNTKELETIVRAPESVLVAKGQFSKTSEQDDRPIEPVKVSPAQIFQLKKDQGLEREMGEKTAERSIIPPGVKSKEMINTAAGLEQSISKVTRVPGSEMPPIVAAPAPSIKPVFVINEYQAPTAVSPTPASPLTNPEIKPFLPPPPLPPQLAPDVLAGVLVEDKPELPSVGNVKIIIKLQ